MLIEGPVIGNKIQTILDKLVTLVVQNATILPTPSALRAATTAIYSPSKRTLA